MENKKLFDKLVRDRIPEIIKNSGATPEIEMLDNLRYLAMLDKKLIEECNELVSAKNKSDKIEEMADVLEILHAIAATLSVPMCEIENARLKKQKERGAFKNKILLKSVIKRNGGSLNGI